MLEFVNDDNGISTVALKQLKRQKSENIKRTIPLTLPTPYQNQAAINIVPENISNNSPPLQSLPEKEQKQFEIFFNSFPDSDNSNLRSFQLQRYNAESEENI